MAWLGLPQKPRPRVETPCFARRDGLPHRAGIRSVNTIPAAVPDPEESRCWSRKSLLPTNQRPSSCWHPDHGAYLGKVQACSENAQLTRLYSAVTIYLTAAWQLPIPLLRSIVRVHFQPFLPRVSGGFFCSVLLGKVVRAPPMGLADGLCGRKSASSITRRGSSGSFHCLIWSDPDQLPAFAR